MTDKTESRDIFIRQYHSAIQSNMSLHKFALELGVLPQSVIRRKNRIKQEIGLQLPPLPVDGDDDAELGDDWKDVFEEAQYDVVDRSDEMFETIIITSAQNATPVFTPFFKSIMKFCEHNDAEFFVIPNRYKNPTSIWKAEDKSEEWWDKRLEPYLVSDYVKVCDSLRIMGHIKVQPTATNPLSGFDSHTGLDSAIFGHPKVQQKVVPTPSKKLPKMLMTTGSITKQNYTDSKAGQKGHFHHSFAAIVIEIDHKNGIFHARYIHSDEKGSFYDLDKRYTPTTVQTNKSIAGLVTGDTHAEFMDEKVEQATYSAPDSIMNTLKPSVKVYHDIEDFYRRNHHHKGDHLLAYSKHHLGRNNVEEGLQVTADFIDRHSRPDCTDVIIKSNHDEALDRWLKEADPKIDPENSRFYYYMMYNLMCTVKKTDTGFSWRDPFEFWCKNPDQQRGLKNVDNTIFLKRDESYTICGIEVGFHGDKGPNGGRGSIKSFTKIGPKTIIGHSHSPGIEEGVYQVGLSARMDLEYVSGPSSWMQTHCIIYPDGKRTLINIINGHWRLKKGA